MAGQRAIYDATLACHQVLRDLGALPVLEEWAEDCLADLNLWANGAGALKVGKASLDARLSLNLDAKIFVVNLLRMLQGFVEKCVEIGSEVHNATRETSELSRAIQDVTDIVGQLSRITISIRKSGTNARIQKADASYDPDHPQIEALSQHLQLLLLVKPSKNGTLQARASSQGRLVLSCRDGTAVIDSDSLTAIQLRLIDANLKRRNRFLYAQRHAMKLSDRDQVPSTSIPAPRKLPLPPVLNPLKSTTEEHGMSKVHSATTATDVQDPIALPTQASAQPATTVISAISSRVTYPRPPLLRRDQNVFQCPCCCQTLSTSMSRGSQWKKHLSRDILPYTCILEDCPHPERLYHTKNLWLSHMFTDHGGMVNWACLACNDSSARPVFYEKSAFIEHLEGRHSSGIKPQQIPMLVSAWQRKTSVSIHSCPLCGFEDEDSDAVLNHTAEHLHSFSLRSLPWAPGEDESDDDLYDGYYEEHPYFNTGTSVGTESERSRSTMSHEQRGLEDLPAMGSGGETTENSRLTEEKIRCILENPNVKKDILHVFFNGIENQEDSSCATPVALHSIKDGWTPLFSASSNGHLEVKYVGDEGTSSDFPRNPTPTSKPETTEGDAVLISHLEPNRPDIANYKFEHPRLRDPWVEEQSKLPKMKIDPRAVEDVKFQESPSSVAERALQLLSSGPDVLPPPENLVSPPTLKSASPPQSIKDLLEPPVPQVEPCATPIAIYSIKDGCTPLYAASSNGHLELVKFLYEHGADMDIHTATNDGCTPLYSASSNGHLEVVKFLYEHGADMDIHTATNDGSTPLYSASSNGHVEVVKFLYEHGADMDIHTATNDGCTPLYSASSNGHLEVVKFLYEHGADAYSHGND